MIDDGATFYRLADSPPRVHWCVGALGQCCQRDMIV